MEIRIRETGTVVTDSEFRAMHPNTGFPQLLNAELLDSFGADVIFEGPQPSTNRYQIMFRDGVIQDDQGRWFTKYSIAEMDEAAKKYTDDQYAIAIRAERNQRLSTCDWTQTIDSPVDKASWATYRQSLRNLPNQTGFPWEVIWPTQPE